MPADLKFKKQKATDECDVYYVKQVGGDALAKVQSGETIAFTRIGQDKNLGFNVSFAGTDAPADIVVPNGQDSATITAPASSQALEWKYTVSFPNDGSTGETVIDLDPIIIINPGINSTRSLIRDFAAFVGGAIVAYLAVKFFPGLLG